MWFLRSDRVYASYSIRTDLPLDNGVYLLDIGATRQTVEEARRDVQLADLISGPLSTSAESVSMDSMDGASANTIKKEDLEQLGSTTHKIPQQQESVWGYCAVAELVLENKTAYVGTCVFCDVVLTAGPARGSRSSAETDAFMMVSDVLASGISYAATNYVMPSPNPAEDIFLPSSTAEAVAAPEEEEMESVEETLEEDVADRDLEIKVDDDVEAPKYDEMSSSQEDLVAPIETPTGASNMAELEAEPPQDSL